MTKEELLRDIAARRNLTIEPFGRSAWRIHGRQVDILVAHLHYLQIDDLNPRDIHTHERAEPRPAD